MAAICRSTIIKEGTPFTSEWSLRSLRNSHAVYVGIYIPFISEWLRRSAGICTEQYELMEHILYLPDAQKITAKVFADHARKERKAVEAVGAVPPER